MFTSEYKGNATDKDITLGNDRQLHDIFEVCERTQIRCLLRLLSWPHTLMYSISGTCVAK